MSNWNAALSGLSEPTDVTSASSVAIAVGTSYTQLKAATDNDWSGFTLILTSRAVGANTDFSIGRGSAGNEYPIIDRMLMSNAGSSYANGAMIYFPLKVPKGERLSAKLGATFTSLYAKIIGHAAAHPGAVASGAFLERVGTAGTGVDLDAGGTANTKGSWVSLGSNANDWKGFYVTATEDNGTSQDFLVDFGIDVSGTKQIIPGMGDTPYCKGSGNTIRPAVIGPIFGVFPAGTNFYARCQCTTNSTTSRHIQVDMHGIAA